MRSSSQLFPVALVSAELVQDLAEDVYSLKPDRSADTSVRIALTRVTVQGETVMRRPPVVLLHGAFQNRGIWLTSDAQGLAADSRFELSGALASAAAGRCRGPAVSGTRGRALLADFGAHALVPTQRVMVPPGEGLCLAGDS